MAVFPSAFHVDHARYNICARGFLNRPYLFIFDRIQVVGEEMVSWGQNSKKRPGDSAEPNRAHRFFSDPGPSIPYGKDI